MGRRCGTGETREVLAEGGSWELSNGDGRPRDSISRSDRFFLGAGSGSGNGGGLADAEGFRDWGKVGATMTRYFVAVSFWARPVGMKVCEVKGWRSRILTSKSPVVAFEEEEEEEEEEKGRSGRGAQTNIFMTAFAGFVEGARW